MYQILFSIGEIPFYSYSVITSLGFLLAIFVFLKVAIRLKLPLEFISDHFLSLFLAALFGARAVAIMEEWKIYEQNSIQMLMLWDGKLEIWGAIIMLLLVFVLHAWRQKENIKKWMDAIMPAMFIGLIFENLASLLGGTRYGFTTELPWGITIESSQVRFTIDIHPIQIYLILLMGVIMLSYVLFVLRAGSLNRFVGYLLTGTILLIGFYAILVIDDARMLGAAFLSLLLFIIPASRIIDRQEGLVGLLMLGVLGLLYFFVGFLEASEEVFILSLQLNQLIQVGLTVSALLSLVHMLFTSSQQRA